ncbi:MAG: hypothetical protein WCB93_09850 [Gallionella sp.]
MYYYQTTVYKIHIVQGLFFTDELEAGPTIEQDTMRIDHGGSVEDPVGFGHDIEKTVLSR